jgi:hypothetical protein
VEELAAEILEMTNEDRARLFELLIGDPAAGGSGKR